MFGGAIINNSIFKLDTSDKRLFDKPSIAVHGYGNTINGTHLGDFIAANGAATRVYADAGDDSIFVMNGTNMDPAYGMRDPKFSDPFIVHAGEGNDRLNIDAIGEFYGQAGDDSYDVSALGEDITKYTISDTSGDYDTLQLFVSRDQASKIHLEENSGTVSVSYNNKRLNINGIEHVEVRYPSEDDLDADILPGFVSSNVLGIPFNELNDRFGNESERQDAQNYRILSLNARDDMTTFPAQGKSIELNMDTIEEKDDMTTFPAQGKSIELNMDTIEEKEERQQPLKERITHLIQKIFSF